MKFIIFLLMLPSVAPAEDVDFSRRDHQLHAGCSFLVAQATTLATGNKYLGLLTGLAVGVAKELVDDKFSEGDLKADALGASLVLFNF